MLGTETDTLDADGDITATYDMTGVTLEDAQAIVAERFTGEIEADSADGVRNQNRRQAPP